MKQLFQKKQSVHLNRVQANATQAKDAGVALPFVLIISIAFVFLSLSIVTISMSSVRTLGQTLAHNRAQQAAEAGIDDYIQRVNINGKLIEYNRENWPDPPPLEFQGNAALGDQGPAINKWVKVSDGLGEFTYDLIERHDENIIGFVLRVTGRELNKPETARTFEVALVQDNIAWYALITRFSAVDPELYKYFRDYRENRRSTPLPEVWNNSRFMQQKWFAQGGFKGSSQNYSGDAGSSTGSYGWRFELGDDDAKGCLGNVTNSWCVRQPFFKLDEIHGDYRTGQEYVIGSMLEVPNGRYQDLYTAKDRAHITPEDMPQVDGEVTVGAFFELNVGRRDGNEVLGQGLGIGAPSLPSIPTINLQNIVPNIAAEPQLHYRAPKSMPPINHQVMQKEADCVFSGPTYIKIENDSLRIASPQTPGGIPKSQNGSSCGSGYDRTGTRARGVIPEFWHNSLFSTTKTIPLPKGNDGEALIYVKSITKDRKACNRADDHRDQNGLFYPGHIDTLHPETVGDCYSGTVFVQGQLDGRLTIVSDQNIVLVGSLRYAHRTSSENKIPIHSKDMLGLIAKNDVMVYWPVQDSKPTGYANNNTGFQNYYNTKSLNLAPFNPGRIWLDNTSGSGMLLQPPHEFELDETKPLSTLSVGSWNGVRSRPHFDAVILAENGSFRTQNPLAPTGQDFANATRIENDMLRVYGSVASKYGILTGRPYGYFTDRHHEFAGSPPQVLATQFPGVSFSWDRRLATMRPPFWPEEQDKSEWKSRGFVEVFEEDLDNPTGP